MKKKIFALVLFLLVLGMFAAAQETSPETAEECGFWCKVGKFLFGDPDRQALAGAAWENKGGGWICDTGSDRCQCDNKQGCSGSGYDAKYTAIVTYGQALGEAAPTSKSVEEKKEESSTTQAPSASTPPSSTGETKEESTKESTPTSQPTAAPAPEKSSTGTATEEQMGPPKPLTLDTIDGKKESTGGGGAESLGFTEIGGKGSGYYLPPSKYIEIARLVENNEGTFGKDSNGNMVYIGNDGHKIIYSPDGKTRIDSDEIFIWDKNSKSYNENKGIQVGQGIQGKISGKITSLGELPVVTQKDGTKLIVDGDGKAELSKTDFNTLKSFSPTDLAITKTSSGNTFSWKDSSGNPNQMDKSTDATTGIKTTTTKLFGQKEERTWTTQTGICKDGCKGSNNWKIKDDLTIENDDFEVQQIDLGGGNFEVYQVNKKTDEIKEIKITPGKGESHKVTKDDKLVEWKVWQNGKLVADADLDEKRNVKQFNHYGKNGELIGICGYGESCTGDSDTDKVIWVKNDAACKGTKSECYNDKTGKLKKITQDQSKCGETGSDPDQCSAITQKEIDHWLSSDWKDIAGGKTRAQQLVGSVLSNWKPGWQGLSSWWLPDTTKEWNKKASGFFDEALLAKYVVPAAVCNYDAKHRTKVPGESSVFIEVSPGIVQFVGSIQAERSKESTPILCHYENDTCPKGLTCKKDICYDSNNKPATGYFYKITWGVTAPTDDRRTPYLDENGIAIKFNLKFKGENWWLYTGDSGRGNDKTIQLKNGAKDGGTITHYSNRDFKEVCIEFGAPPTDVAGTEVRAPICAEFTSSDVGRLEFEGSGASSSTTSSSGKVSYNSNW